MTYRSFISLLILVVGAAIVSVPRSVSAQLRNKAGRAKAQQGAPRTFAVDPGWDESRFPEHAVCYQSPQAIAAIYAKTKGAKPLKSYDKPTDGSLRIVGTGHSFMSPGYGTLPKIVAAAGYDQPRPVTHVGGGMTGSARYKWEQENGIFQFNRKPKPLLLATIANAQWDAMMWGPYYNDRAEYYSCWTDFCLKYNPDMVFYLSDAWPQLGQLPRRPTSESELTVELVQRLAKEKRAMFLESFTQLNRSYEDRVYVLPTSQAMVLAVEYYHQGKLPGVQGIHKAVGGKERSLWRDQLGHLGRGIEALEGYVFYAALYRRSPELIDKNIFGLTDDSYPSVELDKAFRKIAWEAVLSDPLARITDSDGDRIAD
ncbi:hypothetical protein [Planctomycetes bacterium K23_9]|uniref:hypothetical protein n=1 Tax=Stieleria marina TaxID=1930275 RepID=UPI0011A563DE